MSSIVQKIHKQNKTSRNVFDLSNNVQLLTAPGMLLPIRTDEVLPNDEFRFSVGAFARTLQMVVPSFARVKAHIDSFFVPYRLLGTDYQQIIVGDNRGILSNYSNGSYTEAHREFPRATGFTLQSVGSASFQDASGINTNITTPLLLNALGYGIGRTQSIVNGSVQPAVNQLSDGSLGSGRNSVSLGGASTTAGPAYSSVIPFNLIPCQAYQKIYQDYYRNKLWEKENRASYFCTPDMDNKLFTAEELRTFGMCEMRYHDFEKDRITGIIPDENNVLSDGISAYAQDIVSSLPYGLNSEQVFGFSQVPSESQFRSQDGFSGVDIGVYSVKFGVSSGTNVQTNGTTGVDVSPILSRLSALSLRRLQAFQKFAEITDMSKSDYKHQIKAHFGFDVPDLNSDYSTYIGGFDVPLSITDVENTNSTLNEDTGLGYLAGKGTASGGSRQFSFKANEHGIIMHILYLLPQVDYLNVNTDRSTLRFSRYDFAIPEFDDLGFEPVRIMDVYNNAMNNDVLNENLQGYVPYQVIGYLPRYWYYKTKTDANFSISFYSASDSGAVTSNSLNYSSYIVPFPYKRFIDNCISGTTYRGLKVQPSILDKLFPIQLSTQNTLSSFSNAMPFVFTVHFEMSVMRSLSVDGLPY